MIPKTIQREGLVDDFVIRTTRRNLVGNRDSHSANNDHMDHSSIPHSPQQRRNNHVLDELLYAIPANPQSSVGEQESRSHSPFRMKEQHEYLEQNFRPQQQQQQLRKQQRRKSDGSASSSPDRSNILPLRCSLVFTAHKRKSSFSFAVTVFCLLGFGLYNNARSSLRLAVKEVNDLIVFTEKLHRQLGKADRDMRLLEQELATLDIIDQKREDEEIEERVLSQSSAFANPDLIHEMNIVQQKLKLSRDQANKLKMQVSEISKLDAIAKYGSGNIRVKMDLIFHVTADESVPDTGPHMLVMEMASLDLMPHSVYTFLEMVSNGLLNGCSFILNALHVIKAAPLPYDGSSASNLARQFLDHGLESVAFREYAPNFPHGKYTVGFAADGSPSFYINTKDNSEIHVGDPCFAKIVSGFDTIERLENMPTRNGIWLEHRVGIKGVVIL